MIERQIKRKPRLTAAQVDRARRLSAVHGRITVAEMLGVSPTTILQAERRGWQPAVRRLRPVPDDWGIVAPGLGVIDLSQIYHASQTTVLRWLQEKPVARPYNGGGVWGPPADFASLLERHSARRVAAMLGVHEATVKRARERLGIHPRQIAERRGVGWAERHASNKRPLGNSMGRL